MYQEEGMEFGGALLFAGRTVGDVDALSCGGVPLRLSADDQYSSCLGDVPDSRERAGKRIEKRCMEIVWKICRGMP